MHGNAFNWKALSGFRGKNITFNMQALMIKIMKAKRSHFIVSRQQLVEAQWGASTCLFYLSNYLLCHGHLSKNKRTFERACERWKIEIYISIKAERLKQIMWLFSSRPEGNKFVLRHVKVFDAVYILQLYNYFFKNLYPLQFHVKASMHLMAQECIYAKANARYSKHRM